MLVDNHKQIDFFICDVLDSLKDSFKDDMASMEHPIFSLSKNEDHRVLVYERIGAVIKIIPGKFGLATILDKDILLYLASALMNAKNNGGEISQTVRFTAYDYFISTNKGTGGFQYKQLQEGLRRLQGMVIETNIKTNGIRTERGFGIIDNWKIVTDDKNKKAIALEAKLSDWFFGSILGNEVLTIDKDYFKLSKPTEKRLYEIARKHCGNQSAWKINLENLKQKLGITSHLYTLRFNIKKIAKTNHLPEYNITLENDVVMFTRKYPPKEATKPNLLPLYVSKSDIAKVAYPGESDQQVDARVKKLAEQKNVPTKIIVAELLADKQAKQIKAKEPAIKAQTEKNKAHAKKLKADTAGNV